MLEEKIFNNRDNTIELALFVNGVLLTHTTLTRVRLEVGAVVLDSSVTAAAFDLSRDDRLIIKPGAAGFKAGGHVARLIVYDAAHAAGVVWSSFMVSVDPVQI